LGLTAKYQLDRADYTGDGNYWTGVMGWGTTDFNTMITWGSGFIDSWSSPGNSPGTYTHFVGIQSLHYTNGDTDGTDNYGYQLVAGGGTTSPLYLRVNWGSAGSWRTILDSSNYNSYSPTLTGTGASGSWAISVTGSSASCSGNAATATVLQTARTIGGVSFNGSANINLPGVNTAGNQNTTGTSSNITAYTINQNVGTANTPKFLNVYGERVALNSASPQTINTQYNVTELTLTSSISTLTFSNIQASGIVHMWTLVTVGNATVYTITWPAAVKWPGGTAPTLTTTSGKRDIYQFVTYDGGTNIYAIIVGQNL
jgi:hypothetical protein